MPHEKAFDGCVNLKEVIFERESTEESNINIGKDAFLNCDSLKSVKLPENVSSVSSNAFGFSFNENYVKNEDFVVYGREKEGSEPIIISMYKVGKKQFQHRLSTDERIGGEIPYGM